MPAPSTHVEKRRKSNVGLENECNSRSSRPHGYYGKAVGDRRRNADALREADGIGVDYPIAAQNKPCAPSPKESGASPNAVAGTPSHSRRQGEMERRAGDQSPVMDVGGREEPAAAGGGATAATKFDIRLWVLVTDWDPLESFLYDECYLRVCPEPYTLAESSLGDPDVHLTNVSVRRYADSTGGRKKVAAASHFCRRRRPSSASPRVNSGSPAELPQWSTAVDSRERDPFEGDNNGVAPIENENEENYGRGDFVASQAELVQRLGEVGDTAGHGPTIRGGHKSGFGGEAEDTWARGERLWRDKVLPSMERVVRSTLLAARPHIRPRVSSFQLFGFDLLLDRELNPCECSYW